MLETFSGKTGFQIFNLVMNHRAAVVMTVTALLALSVLTDDVSHQILVRKILIARHRLWAVRVAKGATLPAVTALYGSMKMEINSADPVRIAGHKIPALPAQVATMDFVRKYNATTAAVVVRGWFVALESVKQTARVSKAIHAQETLIV